MSFLFDPAFWGLWNGCGVFAGDLRNGQITKGMRVKLSCTNDAFKRAAESVDKDLLDYDLLLYYCILYI